VGFWSVFVTGIWERAWPSSPKLFNGFSKSQSWVDGIAGGKFEFALSPKASITVAGDAGGGAKKPAFSAYFKSNTAKFLCS